MINTQYENAYASTYQNAPANKGLGLKDGQSATLDGAKKLEGQEHIDFLQKQLARFEETKFSPTQEFKQELLQQAQQPIDAMFVLDGKAIGGMTPGVLLPNADMSLYKEGMTAQELGSKLKEKYGDRLEVRTYENEQAPSYKEFMEAYSGKPFSVDNFVQNHAQSRQQFDDLTTSLKESLRKAQVEQQQNGLDKNEAKAPAGVA